MFLFLLACLNTNIKYEGFLERWWRMENPPHELEDVGCFCFYEVGWYPAGDMFVFEHIYLQGPIGWWKEDSGTIVIDNRGTMTPHKIDEDTYNLDLSYAGLSTLITIRTIPCEINE